MQQKGFGLSKKERQKRFFAVLPLFVMPFLVFMLWVLGLVGSGKASGQSGKGYLGLNTALPVAAPAKDSNWNKMNYYEQADRDSAKIKSLRKQDPFFKERITDGFSDTPGSRTSFHYDPYPSGLKIKKDPHVEKVYQKLNALNTQLAKSGSKEKPAVASGIKADTVKGIKSRDVDRLENMMRAMSQPQGQDSEMLQMKELLERISDIQHPDQVHERMQMLSLKNRQEAYPVNLPEDDNLSLLQGNEVAARDSTSNAFYSLDDQYFPADKAPMSIMAAIQEDQTLVSGETVALRLKQDIFIHGLLVPAGQLMTGQAELKGNRLQIVITSVRYENHILPVNLSVYSLDGMEGIPIQDAMTRDVAVTSGSQAAQSLSLSSLDPSFGAQAATAGITAAKSLLSRKARLVKVSLKAGYDVLLVDKRQLNK